MSTELKSHVLRRDEKGLFGIPFKRLLMAGMAGGVLLTLTQNLLGGAPAFGLAIAGGLTALILTGSRGGIPFWRRLYSTVHGNLLLIALSGEEQRSVWLQKLLNLSVDPFLLDPKRLFDAQDSFSLTRLSDWPLYRHPDELDPALALTEQPVND